MLSDPCGHCGGRGAFTGYTAGFIAGQQFAAFETYAENVIAASALEITQAVPAAEDKVYGELQHAMRHAKRWGDYDEIQAAARVWGNGK